MPNHFMAAQDLMKARWIVDAELLHIVRMSSEEACQQFAHSRKMHILHIEDFDLIKNGSERDNMEIADEADEDDDDMRDAAEDEEDEE